MESSLWDAVNKSFTITRKDSMLQYCSPLPHSSGSLNTLDDGNFMQVGYIVDYITKYVAMCEAYRLNLRFCPKRRN